MELQEQSETKQRTQRLRRRLWLERAVFVGVVALGLAYYYFALQGGSACLIVVDGRPTVVVRNRAVAERVLDQIRSEASDVRQATFLQKVTLRGVSAEDNRIVSDVEALKTLSPKLTVVVEGAGVFANGRLLFGLPNQEEAVSALSLLLREFSPPDPDLTRAFRERVRVRTTPIPVGLFLSSSEAVLEKMREMTAPQGTHLVQRGDTAWRIADRYHVSLKRLAAYNPELNLNLLHEDDRLVIPGVGPSLTVIAWQEVEEPITQGPQAGKFQTVRTVYENGMRTERSVIRKPPKTEPKPQSRSPRPTRHRRSPVKVQRPPPQQTTPEPPSPPKTAVQTTPVEKAEERQVLEENLPLEPTQESPSDESAEVP